MNITDEDLEIAIKAMKEAIQIASELEESQQVEPIRLMKPINYINKRP